MRKPPIPLIGPPPSVASVRSVAPPPVHPGPHEEAVEAEYRRTLELAVQDNVERERGIKSLKVIAGDPKQPYVALTFDDGPHGDKTEKLLDRLKQLKVPATFFVVGMQAQRYPSLVERMVLEGHEVGNHTYHHYRLTQIPLDEVAMELNHTRAVLWRILGGRTRLMRPPGGEYNNTIQKIAEREGYANILWSDDPADYKVGRTAGQVTSFVMRDLTPGGIILLHDGIEATYDALPSMIAQIRARKLNLVTVSELIERGGGLLKVRDNRISRTSAV